MLVIFIYHANYLTQPEISYSYNMFLNVVIGKYDRVTKIFYKLILIYLVSDAKTYLEIILRELSGLPEVNSEIFVLEDKRTGFLGSSLFSDSFLRLNIWVFAGALGFLSWIVWGLYHKKSQPYCWKILYYATLVPTVTTLEILDISPIFWVFDSHALWHFATSPMHVLFYR